MIFDFFTKFDRYTYTSRWANQALGKSLVERSIQVNIIHIRYSYLDRQLNIFNFYAFCHAYVTYTAKMLVFHKTRV